MLKALAGNVNLSPTVGHDIAGVMLLKLRDALIATGKYRQAGAGDGLAAHTTGTTNLFTANGGLGYKTSGTWAAAVANSFSNARAWYRLQELDALGLPTGREIGVQRGSGTAAGNDRFNVIHFSPTGWSGSSSANTFWNAGTSQSIYTTAANPFAGAGLNLFGTVLGAPYLGGSATVWYDVWVPDTWSTGNVCPWLLVWDGTALGDTGGAMFYEAVKCSPADTRPYCFGGDTCANLFADTNAQGSNWIGGGGAVAVYAFNGAGTQIICAMPLTTTPEGTGRPGGSANPLAPEAGATYPVLPASLYLDSTPATFKGFLESFEQHFPISVNQMGRATFHAAAVDPIEPPRRSLGYALVPWLHGVPLTLTRGNFTDMRTALPTVAVDTLAPVVSNVSPTASSTIGPTQALSFRAADAASLVLAMVWVQYASGERELAWDGSAFSALYAGSTRTEISAGLTYDFSLVRSPGWPAAPTVATKLVDGAGNVTSQSWGYVLSESALPVVTLISPPASSDIAVNGSVSFRVSDPTGILRDEVFVEFPNGEREVAWDGTAFTAGFDGSTRTVVSAGKSYDYVLTRSNLAVTFGGPVSLGWADEPTIIVSMVDIDGNLVDTTWSYTLAVNPAPDITFAPAAGSEISEAQLVSVDITDPTGLLLFFITVQYESGPPMVVWDGSDLTDGFAQNGSDLPITNGRRIGVLPDDGWIAGFLMRVRAIDSDGHVEVREAAYTLAQAPVIVGPIPGDSLGPEYTPRSDIVERAQARLLEQFRE